MKIKGVLIEALNGIERVRNISPKGWMELSALRQGLYAIFQNILASMAMITAELGLRKPSSYADLRNSGLIDENFSPIAKKIALTRNLLVHAYRKFSLEDLNSIIKDMLPDAEKLVSKLLEILESRNIDPQISATELSDALKSTMFPLHIYSELELGARLERTAITILQYSLRTTRSVYSMKHHSH
ncbi:MAG: HepT-like ribonuclease domain-containing protein [Thermoproteota archaeon]